MTNNSSGALLADGVIRKHEEKMEQRRKEEQERKEHARLHRETVDAAWKLWVEGVRVLRAYEDNQQILWRMEYDLADSICRQLLDQGAMRVSMTTDELARMLKLREARPDAWTDSVPKRLGDYHRDEQPDTLSHRLQTEPRPISRKIKPTPPDAAA
jgi:hypothetical protein